MATMKAESSFRITALLALAKLWFFQSEALQTQPGLSWTHHTDKFELALFDVITK